MSYMIIGRAGQSLTISATNFDRLGVEEHALAENDELRLFGFEQDGQGLAVDFIGVVLADGKIDHVFLPCGRILLDPVVERAHRLGAEMPALAQLVVHHQAHPPGHLAFGPAAVQEFRHALENDLVGHLPADGAEFDVGQPK